MVSGNIVYLTFNSRFKAPSNILIRDLTTDTIFVMLPGRINGIVSPIFSDSGGASLKRTLQGGVIVQLSFTSGTINGIGGSISGISRGVGGLCSPAFSTIYRNAEGRIYRAYKLGVCYCRRGNNIAHSSFTELRRCLRSGNAVNRESIRGSFMGGYYGGNRVTHSVGTGCHRCRSTLRTRREVASIQDIITKRFSKVNSVLRSLTSRFHGAVQYSGRSTRQVVDTLADLNTVIRRYVYLISGNKEVDIRLALSGGSRGLSGNRIVHRVSHYYKEEFSLPAVDHRNGEVHVTVYRVPIFSIRVKDSRRATSGNGLYNSYVGCFGSNFNGACTLIYSNVNANNETTISNGVTTSIVAELLETKLSTSDYLRVIGSTLVIGDRSRSLSAISIADISLCANGAAFGGTNTPMAFMGGGNEMAIHRVPSLPTKVLGNVGFSASAMGLAAKSVVIVMSSNMVANSSG